MHDLCRISVIRFDVVLGYVFLFLQGFSKAFLFTSLPSFFFLLFFYCDEPHCHVCSNSVMIASYGVGVWSGNWSVVWWMDPRTPPPTHHQRDGTFTTCAWKVHISIPKVEYPILLTIQKLVALSSYSDEHPIALSNGFQRESEDSFSTCELHCQFSWFPGAAATF